MHQSIPTPSPLATSHQGAAQRPGGDASRGPSLGQLPLGEGSGTGVVGRSVGFLMGRLGGWGGIEVNIAGALIPGWSITPRLPPLLLLSLPSLHTHTTQVLEQLPSLLPSLLDSLSAGSEAVVVAALGVRTAHSCIPMTGKSMAYWKAQDLRPNVAMLSPNLSLVQTQVLAAIAACPGQFRPVLVSLLDRFRGETGTQLLQVGGIR